MRISRVAVASLFASLIACGQGLVLNYSLQPLEVFRGVFLSRIKGVALYDVTACNLTPIAREVSGGQLQFQARVPVINRDLLSVVQSRSGRRTRLRIAVEAIGWGGQLATLLIATKVVVTTPAITAATAVAAMTIPLFAGTLGRNDEQFAALSRDFIDPVAMYHLPPGACVGKLFLGGYIKTYQGHQDVLP